MKKISDLEVYGDKLSWKFSGDKVNVLQGEVAQALEDNQRNLVFALVGKSNDSFLNVFSASGERLTVVQPPSGFSFSYLTKHPEVGVAVVAGADEKVQGWFDWHFGYDESDKVVFRYCPAY